VIVEDVEIFHRFWVLVAKRGSFVGAGLEFWRKSIHKIFRRIQRNVRKRVREKEKSVDCREDNFLLLGIVLPIKS